MPAASAGVTPDTAEGSPAFSELSERAALAASARRRAAAGFVAAPAFAAPEAGGAALAGVRGAFADFAAGAVGRVFAAAVFVAAVFAGPDSAAGAFEDAGALGRAGVFLAVAAVFFVAAGVSFAGALGAGAAAPRRGACPVRPTAATALPSLAATGAGAAIPRAPAGTTGSAEAGLYEPTAKSATPHAAVGYHGGRVDEDE
jgi:hypothetical protein